MLAYPLQNSQSFPRSKKDVSIGKIQPISCVYVNVISAKIIPASTANNPSWLFVISASHI